MSSAQESISKFIDDLEDVCDYDDLDTVEAISYRQGALQVLREILNGGGTVPKDILTRWLDLSQQAIDLIRPSCGGPT